MPERITRIEKILASLSGDVRDLTASQINKYLDRLDVASSLLTDVFIEVGRGAELFSETMKLNDPLALLCQQIFDIRSVLRTEVSLRYGPNAPSRLPTRRRS